VVDEYQGSAEPHAQPVVVSPGDVAYMIYTSGSTGKPKGVLVEHRGVLNMLSAVQDLARIEPTDSALHFYGLAFDGSVVNVFLMLLAGARLVMRGEQWHSQLTGTTIGFFTPSVLSVLDKTEQFRLILVGGEALAPSVVARCKCPLLNIYGPTEITVISSAQLLVPPGDGALVSAGPPLPGVMYSVVDSALRPLPIGCVGELIVHGVGVARGYRNLPDKTASVFLADVGHFPGRCYRSGDKARWLEDGSVQVLGRIDGDGQVCEMVGVEPSNGVRA
jgi:non-ribosomal peptide synthetase component F